MTRSLIVLCALFTALPSLLAAQRMSAEEMQRAVAVRDSLETEILTAFANRNANDLRLDATARTELSRILLDTHRKRKALTGRSWQVGQRISAALRAETTPDSVFQRLLEENRQLRSQQNLLWHEEQRALQAVLSPRQHAQMLRRWADFQDDIREMVSRRLRRTQNQNQSATPK